MSYRQNIQSCLASAIGDFGLTEAERREMRAASALALKDIQTKYADGRHPFLHLPEKVDDLPAMRAIAERARDHFSDVVVLGTGGSSLGGRALCEMGAASRGDGRPSPRIHIVTNIDPNGFEDFIDGLDLRRTGWIVISKSGGTAETLMQFMSILPRLRDALGDTALARHVTVITEERQSPLTRLADAFALPRLAHDAAVGGRYSVLSVVGMLPALIAGLDPTAVRAGAREVLRDMLQTAPEDGETCAPILGATVSIGLYARRGMRNTVMLAYGDRLGSLCRWYRQLWAESIGKNGHGSTPIYGTGPVDQHSQLQLWLDGPNDKMFTILGTRPSAADDPATARPNATVDPELANLAGLDYMGARSLGDLMEACRLGTTETLAQHGKPVRTIELDAIDERCMGALMMHFMIETVAAAALLKVDPFDQPAVEHGKRLARAYLSGAAGPATQVGRAVG